MLESLSATSKVVHGQSIENWKVLAIPNGHHVGFTKICKPCKQSVLILDQKMQIWFDVVFQ